MFNNSIVCSSMFEFQVANTATVSDLVFQDSMRDSVSATTEAESKVAQEVATHLVEFKNIITNRTLSNQKLHDYKTAVIFGPIPNAFMVRGMEPKRRKARSDGLAGGHDDEAVHVFLAKDKAIRDEWIQLINTQAEIYATRNPSSSISLAPITSDKGGDAELDQFIQIQKKFGYKP